MAAPLIPLILRVLAGVGMRAGPALATAGRAVASRAAPLLGRVASTEARAAAAKTLADPSTKRAIIGGMRRNAPKTWRTIKSAKRLIRPLAAGVPAPEARAAGKSVADEAVDLLAKVAPHVLHRSRGTEQKQAERQAAKQEAAPRPVSRMATADADFLYTDMPSKRTLRTEPAPRPEASPGNGQSAQPSAADPGPQQASEPKRKLYTTPIPAPAGSKPSGRTGARPETPPEPPSPAQKLYKTLGTFVSKAGNMAAAVAKEVTDPGSTERRQRAEAERQKAAPKQQQPGPTPTPGVGGTKKSDSGSYAKGTTGVEDLWEFYSSAKNDRERNQFAQQLGIKGSPIEWFRQQGFEPPEQPQQDQDGDAPPKRNRASGFLRGLQNSLQAVAQVSGYQGGFTNEGQPRRGRNRRRFAQGGHVAGTGYGDTVQALLTPGEWVLTPQQVKRIGANNLRNLPKFAAGGPVKYAMGGPVGAPSGDIGQGFAELAGVVGLTAQAFEGPNGLRQALLQGPPALKQFSQNILASSRHLERWDGKLAASSLMLDRNRLLRQRDEARSTSGSGSALTDAVDDMEGELQELRNAARTFLNVFGIFAAKVVTMGAVIVKVATPIGRIAEIAEDWWNGEGEQVDGLPWAVFLNDAAKRASEAGRRPQRNGPDRRRPDNPFDP